MTEPEDPKQHIKALEERRDALEARCLALENEVDGLEDVVARLEAEGLKPLVDRLRSQIGSIKKLVVAMAIAIDELTEGGADTEAVSAIADEIKEA